MRDHDFLMLMKYYIHNAHSMDFHHLFSQHEGFSIKGWAPFLLSLFICMADADPDYILCHHQMN